METITELLQHQEKVGEEIQHIIRNYKKDSPTRKTESYFKERFQSLSMLWDKFEIAHKRLLSLVEQPNNINYFKDQCHETTRVTVQNYLEIFNTHLKQHKVEDPDNQISDSESRHSNRKGLNSSIKLLRRLNCEMSMLENYVNKFADKIDIKIIDELWNKVENIYQQFDDVEDPLIQKRYERLYEIIIEKKHDSNASPNPKACSSAPPFQLGTSTSFPLPKVDIPLFDGNYNNWNQFHNMFRNMVH